MAAVAAVLAVLLALLVAGALRLAPGRPARLGAALAALGYAVPGSVVAVGVLVTLGGTDNALDRWARANLGLSTGLLLSGTFAALIFAYLVRFIAVSLQTVDAGLTRIRPSLEGAARTLGRGPLETLGAVHAPLLRGSVLTAGLLVFVEVMKELPATLIVRPFNFDTLAVRVYRLASDERLAEASTAALTIVAVGLVPVVLLSAGIARSRPGGGDAEAPAAGAAR
jgi:iron(III) transport system permease protein